MTQCSNAKSQPQWNVWFDVSITNTEVVMANLMISRSGDGHIVFKKNAI